MKQVQRPALRRWTRRGYERLIDHGFLARRRWGYAAIETLGADATIAPRAAPVASIRVADLLP